MNNRLYQGMTNPIYNQNVFSEPSFTKLLDSIYRGNLNDVEQLISATSSLLFMVDSSGNDALLVAALYGRKTIFDTLIKKYKMSPYKTNNEGNSPLLIAAYSGKLGMVNKLINLDSHLINQRNKNGNDIFLIACLYNHKKLIHYLAKSYPEKFITTTNNQGWNVVSIAAYSPAIDAASYLLNNFTWTKDQLSQALNITNHYKEGCTHQSEKWLQERISPYNQIGSLLTQKIQILSGIQPASIKPSFSLSLFKYKPNPFEQINTSASSTLNFQV
jgi:hypothetical protein